MSIFICQYCQGERKSKKSLIGHEVFCKSNPNHKQQKTEESRKLANRRLSCVWCGDLHTTGNIKKHQRSCIKNPEVILNKSKTCPVCNKSFINDSITCSHSCSNKMFRSGEDNGNWKQDAYQSTCFLYHGKKCLVCGEEKIVAAHHVNEDHNDNRPENLVPLCPTHHQYVHSRYKDEVQSIIDQYLQKKYLSMA